MIETVKKILNDKQNTPVVFKRNVVKEYLQILTLSFLYSHKQYKSLIFYGGSSLRHCFELPRLSEDLDFVDVTKTIDIRYLLEDIRRFFRKKHHIVTDGRHQKFRCILKFPILRQLDLATIEESDLLFLKVELFKEFDFCTHYETQVVPIFKFGQSLIVKTFDLSTLMATKIDAVLHRKWERTSKNGKILATVKGRDYFDLMWYLKKNIQPNIACISGVSNKTDLYHRLIDIVETVDIQSIKYDLGGLIEDQAYIDTLKDSLKAILTKLIRDRI